MQIVGWWSPVKAGEILMQIARKTGKFTLLNAFRKNRQLAIAYQTWQRAKFWLDRMHCETWCLTCSFGEYAPDKGHLMAGIERLIVYGEPGNALTANEREMLALLRPNPRSPGDLAEQYGTVQLKQNWQNAIDGLIQKGLAKGSFSSLVYLTVAGSAEFDVLCQAPDWQATRYKVDAGKYKVEAYFDHPKDGWIYTMYRPNGEYMFSRKGFETKEAAMFAASLMLIRLGATIPPSGEKSSL